jgi:predicted MFS family arabinose efflux permease
MAHGRRERPLRTAGLAGMALAMIAAGLAPSYGLFLATLLVYGPASGVATCLAQSALVSADPSRAEAVLARWSLLGLAGDLLAPAALAASVALGLGWRGALLAVGAFAAVQAALAAWAPDHPAAAVTEQAGSSLRDALGAAVSCPRLLGWSLAVVLCGLLDEVLVAFGALWLSERLGADATVRAAILTSWVAGSFAGAALLERLAARFRPPALLAVSGVGCAAAYAGWLATRTPVASALALAIAGLFAAAHYPLLQARAFAAMPGRPNVVLAAGALFQTLDLALPLLVGVVADGIGLFAAMLVLLLQPAGVVVAAVAARTRPGRGAAGGSADRE